MPRLLLLSLPLFLVVLGIAGVSAQFPAQVPQIRGGVIRLPNSMPQAAAKLTDEQALAAAGLTAGDAQQLLDYLRQRTLSPSDLGRIRAVIRRFAEEDFDERLKASIEAERFGPAAVGPLKAAQSDPDPEIAYRATETLKRLEKVPHAAVSLAAVRAVAKLAPAEAARVLLKFLPMADDDTVADAVRSALIQLAVRNGQPESALLEGLTSPESICRAAAAVALIEGGPQQQRIRIPDALPRVWEAIRAESDPEAKFQMVYSLVMVTRDNDALSTMIDLLPDLPRGRLWQAEDFLLQLAGTDAPKVVLGKSRDSLIKGRDAWKSWWDLAAAKTNLIGFTYTPRVLGRTILVLSDLRFNRDGTVLELGPDLKERWRISGLAMPTDAQLLSNGTLAISGQHSSGITIRDTEGRLLANRPVTIGMRENVAVQQLQWLPNDHLLLVGRNAVVELKKDSDTLVMQYSRPQHDILSARRLPDGTTAVLIQNGNAPFNCFFLDSNGKPLPDRRLTIGPLHYQGAVMDAPAPNRLLVTEQARVTEYDTQTGKSIWQYSPGGQPRSVQRLPNGNTLLVVDGSGGMFSNAADPGRVIEVTPEGDEVWTYQLDARAGGLVLAKAYRR